MKEYLTEEQLEYHKFVVSAFKTKQAALDSWLTYLSSKYGLTRLAQISDEGEIIRNEVLQPAKSV